MDYSLALSNGEITDKEVMEQYELRKETLRKHWIKTRLKESHKAVKMITDMYYREGKKSIPLNVIRLALADSMNTDDNEIMISARRDIIGFDEHMIPLSNKRLTLKHWWDLVSNVEYEDWQRQCIALWREIEKRPTLAEKYRRILRDVWS